MVKERGQVDDEIQELADNIVGILDAAKKATERSEFHEEVHTSLGDVARRQAAAKAYHDAVDRVRVHMTGTAAQTHVVQPPSKYHPPGKILKLPTCALKRSTPTRQS